MEEKEERNSEPYTAESAVSIAWIAQSAHE